LFKNIKIVDLTHSLLPGMATWDASCGFLAKVHHDYDQTGNAISFRVQHLSMHAGVGTHMDAPAHCFPKGKTIDEISVCDLFAPCTFIDVSSHCHEDLNVNVEHIKAWEKNHGTILERTIVIIRTGWDNFFSNAQRYRNDLKFPAVDKDAARYLLSKKILGLGIDTLSPDRPNEGYPVHKAFLSAGTYIIENVANASSLPPLGAHILALPLKIQGGTEAPLRLVGLMK